MKTDDEIIGTIETALKGYNLGDIKYLLKGKKSIAGFILCSCLIDHLTCFRYGKESTKVLYKCFVGEYLKEYGYDPNRLYVDLRCRLVHNYTVGRDSYSLTTGTRLHFKKWFPNSTVLDLGNFVSDLEKVLDKYLNQIRTDAAIRKLAIRRYKEVGILEHAPYT